LLDGLGYNIDPELTPRLLGLVLDPAALRSNELLDLLFAQTSERETRQVAYRWLLDHFDAVVARLGKDNAGVLPALSRGACSAAEAEQVRSFFAPRVAALMGGPRNLDQSLEQIELCSAFSAQHAMQARAYLAARAQE
jgi:alanyl aminopeptidase